MSKENKIVSPSIPVLNAALILCDPNEYCVVAAVQAIHWVLDPDEEGGVEMLCRALPNMPKRTIERAVASLKKKGLLSMKRGFRKASRFSLHFEDMAFKDLRALIRQDGVIQTAKLAEMDRHIGGDISNTDSTRETLDIDSVTPTLANSPKKLGVRELIAVFCDSRKLILSTSSKITGRDSGAAKLLLNNNPDLTKEEVLAHCEVFFRVKDKYTEGSKWSLAYFCNYFNLWEGKGDTMQLLEGRPVV